jgi:DNA-binding GntR family transcriptional regulator
MQLARQILEDIKSGRYPEGSLLPNETEFCEAFSVSRTTIRAAMQELQIRGLISRKSGVGTRVEAPTSRERFIQTNNLLEEIIQFPGVIRFQLLKSENVDVDEETASWLGCRPGERFVRASGLRLPAEGPAICYSVHFVPAAFSAAVPLFDGTEISLATLLSRQFGEEIGDLRQVFDAVNLDATHAGYLNAPSGDAALLTSRWFRSEEGRLLLVSRSLFPKGRYSYAIKMARTPTGAQPLPSES